MGPRRVFLFVLDSLGVGALSDAPSFGDAGAHTLDHLVEAAGVPRIPRLVSLGLGNIPGVTSLPKAAKPEACFGRLAEASAGKDTSTGHWELMNCPLDAAFPTFPRGFDPALLQDLAERARVPGWLGNEAASGTEIIARLGAEHIATGKPIVYTSADSVLQIAAHERHFGLKRLLRVCEIARELTRPMGLGRVIARPFVGEVGAFQRTYNRKDFSLLPPRQTTLDRLKASGVPVVGIGKIEDIFAGRGLTRSVHTEGNRDGMAKALEAAEDLVAGLVFVNLVDFDMLFGHRRDPAGYRRALEEFDEDLIRFEALRRDEDVFLLTADHGNDPTKTEHTDHTREHVPLLCYGDSLRLGVPLGTRSTFADVGATVEALFALPATGPGVSFHPEMSR
ncbi:MAG: phosphopentomutase [Planctomycetota bacterium]